MNSPNLDCSLIPHPLRIDLFRNFCLPLAVLVNTVVLCAVSAADESRGGTQRPVVRIDTPFDANTMPAAEKLLSENPLASPSWQVKIVITESSADASGEGLLRGNLLRRDNRITGTLKLGGDADQEIRLLINDTLASAWTSGAKVKNQQSVERLVSGISLLEMLMKLPDQTAPLEKTISSYQVTNQGVGQVSDGQAAYWIEAIPNKDAVGSPRISQLKPERILIAISTNGEPPLEISAIMSAGSRLSMRVESIAAGDVGDVAKNIDNPPAGAHVIDLSAKGGSDELTNPVPYGPESLKRGKLLYIADCEVCHSVDGTGRDSDVTDNAADLTSTEFWLSDGSEAATFLAIRDGAGDEMPGYQDEYRDEKMIWDLVNYIRSLQKK